jgi:hypothetical protein
MVRPRLSIGIASSAALMLFSMAPAAAVEPVETALRDMGMLGGRWAGDCSKPPSPDNWQAFFAGVTMTWLGGPNLFPNVYIVQEARHQPDGTVALRSELQRDHSISEVVYDMRPDRSAFRPISIHIKRGDQVETLVKDGVFVEGNVKAPWYVHCAPGYH